MNLIELSKKTNKPIEFLKQVILDKFGIIILSEYNSVKDRVVTFFTGSDTQRITENLTVYDTNEDAQNLVKEENKCLDELTDIQNPELAYTRKFLRYCIDKKYLIFIDTCSLLNDNFQDFYKMFIKQKGNSNISLYIPYVVIEELKHIILDKKKEKDVIDKAIKILQFVQLEETNNNVVTVGNENDKRANEHSEKVIHADRVIIEKLIFFRNDSKSSLFITQDFDATVDALKQNDWHSTKSSALILVKKISKKGVLIDNTKETVNPILPIDK